MVVVLVVDVLRFSFMNKFFMNRSRYFWIGIVINVSIAWTVSNNLSDERFAVELKLLLCSARRRLYVCLAW